MTLIMINSVFGKTMERVDYHSDTKFGMTEDQINCLEHKPNWVRTYNFGANFSMAELSQTSIKDNKPVYVRQAILDISKTLLYEFHYGYMVPKYGPRQRLLYNDMDSMIYEIQIGQRTL